MLCEPRRALRLCGEYLKRLSPLLLSTPAFAQTAAPAGPSYAPMFIALLAVLALVPLAMWLLKRLGAGRAGEIAGLKIIAQLALGTRERLVVVEAGERWLLLGVTAGSVTRVGTLPKGTLPAGGASGAPFAALLQAARGKHETQ